MEQKEAGQKITAYKGFDKNFQCRRFIGVKQTERSRRMKQEDIEQEANDYAYENLWYPGEIFYERDLKKMMECFADAFIAGAEWRINHAWHKAEDLPQHNAWFLAQIGNDCFKTLKMRIEYDRWEQWCKVNNIVRWAYIEDLLLNTEDWIYESNND